MHHTYIGTTSGVYRLDEDGLTSHGLDGHRVWAIHGSSNGNGHDVVLAGTYGQGMFRSVDSGQTWQLANEGLTSSAFRTIQNDPGDEDALICGTEPARAYRSTDRGKSWQEMEAIAGLDGSADWYLPYSPRAGAIRNFYSPPGEENRLLASIEVGGLLDSHDRGENWQVAPILGDDDIHHITGHPTNSRLLYAALGWASLDRDRRREDEPKLGGLARSDDGGKTWRKFFSDYTRAVIIPPSDPAMLLASPGKQVGRQADIIVSNDGGESWQPANNGIEIPMADQVENFFAAPDDSIWAVCAAGRLLRAEPGEWSWRSMLPADSSISVESISFVE